MVLKLLVLLIACGFSYEQGYVINNNKFPDDFMFGVATSAYQIEGAWNESGKSASIWDDYLHNVVGGENGDVACDSYHKYETDVALLKDLGVKHYKFSLSWPRILPNGTADYVNEEGVQYYKNLINLLNTNGIVPMVTIYHWDLPQVLSEQKGFVSDEFPEWYKDYARVVFEQFGDSVKYWLTFHEPTTFCQEGYGYGRYAPGVNREAILDYQCGHNLLKAHAAAWHLYDEEFREKQGGQIAIALSSQYYGAVSNRAEDEAAAEACLQFRLGWFAHPIYLGDYPEYMKFRIGNRSIGEGFEKSRLPEFTEEEIAYINGTNDFFALNFYNSYEVEAGRDYPAELPPGYWKDIGPADLVYPGDDSSWGLTPMLKWIQSNYGNPPVIITDNGERDMGGLYDDARINSLRFYMSRVRDAIDEGVNVFGYTLWSLIDSFHWSGGYMVKFGLYEVDFQSENKTRTPKLSARWYKSIIKSGCLLGDCD